MRRSNVFELLVIIEIIYVGKRNIFFFFFLGMGLVWLVGIEREKEWFVYINLV